MQTEVTVLADSVSPDGVRLTTMLCIYPRFIHSEMLRHRMFSHSVASSRAIPTEKNIEQVRKDPFIPSTFNRRVKGMGVGEEFDEADKANAEKLWREAGKAAAWIAEELNELGLDKSRANRLLEPFLYVVDIITATEWDNFFALRDHEGAQPEFQDLAKLMRQAMGQSSPMQFATSDAWHLPLVTEQEREGILDWEILKKISASRCAAISYHKHAEGEEIDSSLARFGRLAEAVPPHLSPLEHVARPAEPGDNDFMEEHGMTHEKFFGNLRGWVQFRKEYKNEGRADLLAAAAQEA